MDYTIRVTLGWKGWICRCIHISYPDKIMFIMSFLFLNLTELINSSIVWIQFFIVHKQALKSNVWLTKILQLSD